MKILIVEDEFIVAENISAILESQGYKTCGVAATAEAALQLVRSENPSLVICDIQIKGESNGISFVRQLKEISNVPFLYLTAFADSKTLSEAAGTEPSAYLVKPFTEIQLIAAVQMIKIQQAKLQEDMQAAPSPTKREIEILEMMARGKSTKQIAEALVLSIHTIQTHRKNMMQKFQTSNDNSLIMLAVKNKWIKI